MLAYVQKGLYVLACLLLFMGSIIAKPVATPFLNLMQQQRLLADQDKDDPRVAKLRQQLEGSWDYEQHIFVSGDAEKPLNYQVIMASVHYHNAQDPFLAPTHDGILMTALKLEQKRPRSDLQNQMLSEYFQTCLDYWQSRMTIHTTPFLRHWFAKLINHDSAENTREIPRFLTRNDPAYFLVLQALKAKVKSLAPFDASRMQRCQETYAQEVRQ